MKWIVTSVMLMFLWNASVLSQTVLVGWNFEDQNLTADDGTDGSGNAPNNLGQTISANAGGTVSYAGGNAPTPAFSLSTNNWAFGEFLVFTVNTTNFTGLSVEFDVNGTNPGPRDFKLAYSTAGTGGTFTNVPGATFQVTTSFSGNPMFTFNLPTAVENQGNVAIRIECNSDISVNGGSIANGGQFRIDNLQVISSLDDPLPVELSSFTAVAGDGKVVLKWTTASEINNDHFEILRSSDPNGGYAMIGQEAGQGNSAHFVHYSFEDKFVANGTTYWYKLVDVDVNGIPTEHGPIVATPQAAGTEVTTINSDVPSRFRLYAAYPNPFNPSTNLKFDIPGSSRGMSDIKVAIFNTLGQKVRVLVNASLTPGTYVITWDGKSDSGRELPGGIYYAVMAAGYSQETVKLILVK